MKSKPRQNPSGKKPTPTPKAQAPRHWHRRCSTADLARDLAATVDGLRELLAALAGWVDDLEAQGRRLAILGRRGAP